MSRTVVIVGGGGFVGCYLARALCERGYGVVAFDRVPPNRQGLHILGDAAGVVRFIEGDVTVPSEVTQALCMRPPDVVVNLAALQMLDWCNQHPVATYRVNVLGAMTVLDLATKLGIRRVVQVSSTGALVAAQAAVIDERHPIADLVDGHPAGHYGASKAMAEILATAYARVQGLEVVVLRFPSVYGFGTPHETFVASAVQAVVLGREFHALSGGDDRRDYLYAVDAAQALVKAIEAPVGALRQRVFFIALGRLHTDRDVVDVLKALDPSCRIGIGPGRTPVEASVDSIRATYDITAAESQLGFKPAYTLRDGLADYVECWRAFLRGCH